MRHLLIAAVAAMACGGSPTQPDAVMGQPFEVRAGTTAELPDGIRLRFDSVLSDSRCPIDAICVRAGEAVIAITLSKAGTVAAEFDVQTDPPDRRSAVYSGHSITLTALQPFPRSDRQFQPSDYVATFVVNVR
ncbi:MAG TPA: hypothetical protein VFP85_19745 [Vicinamibacterales bacterium]|nr:hypothetical protein [Vicinamibacterales bacterium]